MLQEAISHIHLAHQRFWVKNNIAPLFYSVVLFLFALVFQHYVYIYIDYHANVTAVGDLFLNNLPTLNLDLFIVQGALLLTGIIIFLLAIKPGYIPFTLKSLALFIIIRSCFISLTHLGVNLHQITLNTNSIGFGLYDFLYNGKNDFFFSGHVGASFLMALIFWNEKVWHVIFLLFSVMFGISMLFAHMHYSIDIFAAPFITYTILIISKKIFRKDFQLII